MDKEIKDTNIIHANILKANQERINNMKFGVSKLKDLPRYKVVTQYEGQMKQEYAKGLGDAIREIMKKRTKMMKDVSDFTANTGTD